MSRSKLDQTQIMQTVFDESAESLKVQLVDAEIVLQSATLTVVEDDGFVDCSGYEYVCLYGTGTVEISPYTDGTAAETLTITPLQPQLLCARSIKITGTGSLVIQSI